MSVVEVTVAGLVAAALRPWSMAAISGSIAQVLQPIVVYRRTMEIAASCIASLLKIPTIQAINVTLTASTTALLDLLTPHGPGTAVGFWRLAMELITGRKVQAPAIAGLAMGSSVELGWFTGPDLWCVLETTATARLRMPSWTLAMESVATRKVVAPALASVALSASVEIDGLTARDLRLGVTFEEAIL